MLLKIFKRNILLTSLVTLILVTPLLCLSNVEPRNYNIDELKTLAIREEYYKIKNYDKENNEYFDINEYFNFNELEISLGFMANSNRYEEVALTNEIDGLVCDELTYTIKNRDTLYFRNDETSEIIPFNLISTSFNKKGYFISLRYFIQNVFGTNELTTEIKKSIYKYAWSIKAQGSDDVFDKIFDLVYKNNIKIYDFKFEKTRIITSYNTMIKDSSLLIVSILCLSVYISLFVILNNQKEIEILYLRYVGFSLAKIKFYLFAIHSSVGTVSILLSLLVSYLIGFVIHLINPLLIYEIGIDTLKYIIVISLILIFSSLISLIRITKKKIFLSLREE